MPDFEAADGARLHYRDDGDGPPLLCLAGLTRDGTAFDDVAPHLGHRRLIRPDYRGRGRSDRTGPATYTVAQEAADAVALLDHLGLGSVPILGTSRGGLIAMLLAATARDRLAGVCLVDIGPEIDRAGLDRIAAYVGRAPEVATLDAAAARLATTPGFDNVPEGRWQAEAARIWRETPAGLILAYDPALAETMRGAVAPPDLWPLFDALAGMPLALIRGANSDLLSEATAAAMRRRRPDMLFADVLGRAHVPFLDEPESLGVLHAFLGQIP